MRCYVNGLPERARKWSGQGLTNVIYTNVKIAYT
jgi:hypothetical protein